MRFLLEAVGQFRLLYGGLSSFQLASGTVYRRARHCSIFHDNVKYCATVCCNSGYSCGIKDDYPALLKRLFCSHCGESFFFELGCLDEDINQLPGAKGLGHSLQSVCQCTLLLVAGQMPLSTWYG